MNYFKINLPTLLLSLLVASFYCFSAASVSCTKIDDSGLKERLPNQKDFISSKITFAVMVDELTTGNAFFKDTPFYIYLKDQTHVIAILSFLNNETKKQQDTTIKLSLQSVNGRYDFKLSDTLILRSGVEYTIKKIKTINSKNKNSVGFIIPQATSQDSMYTSSRLPRIKFTVPEDVLPYRYETYMTFVGKSLPERFGYDVNDFSIELFTP